MPNNIAAQGGESIIRKFEITSNYSEEPTDISSGITNLSIFESLFDSTVRVSATYTDTGYGNTKANSEETFNNSAGEKTELLIEDTFGKTLDFTGDYHLRTAKNVREAYGGADTAKTTIRTSFYSQESITNNYVEKDGHYYRVSKKYERKISDNISTILKDVLKTPKEVDVDPSKNDFNFYGWNEKVFHKVYWLAKRTVPEGIGDQGVLAGYLFYETAKGSEGTPGGYHFKSIDLLFKQKPIRKMILTNTNQIPAGYTNKILNHVEHTSIDLDTHLLTGDLFKRKIETFNPFDNKFDNTDDFDFQSQNLVTNNGGKEFWKIAADMKAQDVVVNYNSKMYDHGTTPTGSTWKEQKKESKEINFDMTEIIRQSTNRINQMLTIQMTVIIALDLGIHVGDMILLDFPEISNSDTQEVSKNKSGIYMVMDIHHRITAEANYTSIQVCRDTIYRKEGA
jgi:hypothetical protein